MRLLLISNGYPSKEKPFGSIYVKNHYRELKKLPDYHVDKHVIKRSFTTLIGSIKKYSIAFLSFFRKILKDYDVIHVHNLSPLYLLACIYKTFRPNVKIVLTVHGSDVNELSSTALIIFYKYILNYNDIFIAVGDELAERSKKLFSIKIDHVLCAGFNQEKIYNIDKSIDEREIDYLYVGSFYYKKGVDIIVDAISSLDDKSSKFVFVGSGKLKEYIEGISCEYDITIKENLGQDELNKLYNNSKFFLFASRKEGFGLALAEAMYCGAVPIVIDNAQLKKQVIEDHNGFVFRDSDNLALLIEKTKNINREDWYNLSTASINDSSRFTLEGVIESLDVIYKEAINE